MRLKTQTQQILYKYKIYPSKRLGQNFLIDEGIIKTLVKAAKITRDDVVLEVGAGTGNVTKELTKFARQVIAVEKDPRLVELLKNELSTLENVKIIHADILKYNLQAPKLKSPDILYKYNKEIETLTSAKLNRRGYKLVGAPPYYLTARLFRRFLEELENKPKNITLLIQKGVAERVAAQPPKANILSTAVALYGSAKIEKMVSKNVFWPTPEVDSAILHVSNIKNPDIDEKLFFKIVKAGFSSPRKQLLSNLVKSLKLNRTETLETFKKLGLDPICRAENLSIDDWTKLIKLLKTSTDAFVEA